MSEQIITNQHAQQVLEQLLTLESQADSEQLFIIGYLIPVVSMLCDSEEEFHSAFTAQIQQNMAMDRLSEQDELEIKQLIAQLGLA